MLTSQPVMLTSRHHFLFIQPSFLSDHLWIMAKYFPFNCSLFYFCPCCTKRHLCPYVRAKNRLSLFIWSPGDTYTVGWSPVVPFAAICKIRSGYSVLGNWYGTKLRSQSAETWPYYTEGTARHDVIFICCYCTQPCANHYETICHWSLSCVIVFVWRAVMYGTRKKTSRTGHV